MPDPHVRVTNYSDADFSDRYDSVRYTVPAGGDAIVPFEAACLWLGNPRTKDIGPTRRHRTDEIDRVMVRCGVVDNSFDTLAERRPPLKVHAADDGREILMVVDDPHGTGYDPFGGGAPSGEDAEARIYQLEQALVAIASSSDAPALAEALAAHGIGDTQGPGSVVTTKARARKGAPPVDAPARPKASA